MRYMMPVIQRALAFIFLGICSFFFGANARADSFEGLPPGAKVGLPLLQKTADKFWPEAPYRSVLAGQIEQETCITLKHSKCFTPRAELKTSREWGRGYGQMTTAYNKDGSVRFDAAADAKKLDKALSAWDHNLDPYNPEFNMMAFVLMDRNVYKSFSFVPNGVERLAFMLASYNGGTGGTLKDRTLCRNTPGCKPDVWFGNVEKYSFKNKIAAKGYGKSFFEINRSYPRIILFQRAHRYAPWFSEPRLTQP